MASGTSSSLKVLLAGTSWRLFGSERAGDVLLQAMSGKDEQNRMLAGISLVKAGQRSFDLIRERIESGEATPDIVRLLPDIGGEKARALLEEVREQHGELGIAANESIDLLDRIKKL